MTTAKATRWYSDDMQRAIANREIKLRASSFYITGRRNESLMLRFTEDEDSNLYLPINERMLRKQYPIILTQDVVGNEATILYDYCRQIMQEPPARYHHKSKWYHENNGGNPYYSFKKKQWTNKPFHWVFRFRQEMEGTDELREIRNKMLILKLKRK